MSFADKNLGTGYHGPCRNCGVIVAFASRDPTRCSPCQNDAVDPVRRPACSQRVSRRAASRIRLAAADAHAAAPMRACKSRMVCCSRGARVLSGLCLRGNPLRDSCQLTGYTNGHCCNCAFERGWLNYARSGCHACKARVASGERVLAPGGQPRFHATHMHRPARYSLRLTLEWSLALALPHPDTPAAPPNRDSPSLVFGHLSSST